VPRLLHAAAWCVLECHCEGCGKSTRATANRADLSKVVYQKLGACALSRTYPTASMLQCVAARYSAIIPAERSAAESCRQAQL
jgi:hypothetical protein